MGERILITVNSMIGRGHGWTVATAESDGVVITLDDKEYNNGGVFLTSDDLCEIQRMLYDKKMERTKMDNDEK